MPNATNSIDFVAGRPLEKPVKTLSEDHGHAADDNALLGSLSLRLKNADWSKFERGSDAFLDVDRDLKMLAKDSPDKAAEIWAKNAPKGVKAPDYIKEALEQLNEPKETGKPPQERASEDGGYEVPGSIKKRYLQAEGKFHYREAQNKLAFEDRGARMVTEHNDPNVAGSMVELAQAKGWSKLKVTGHEDFKREVWLQASLKNIEVIGFKPKDVDLAKLEELRSARMKNGIEPVTRSTQDQRALIPTKGPDNDPQQGGTPTTKPARVSHDPERNPEHFSGKLLAHGEAHYDFDKQQEKTYFVKVETVNGTKIHWGDNLKDLVSQSPSAGKVGEQIHLLAKPVPQLTGDYKVAASVLTDVLKEKGYSTKVLDKAVAEATKRLDVLKKGGELAPGVKMFDKNAPRERARDQLQPSKSKQRQIERNR